MAKLNQYKHECTKTMSVVVPTAVLTAIVAGYDAYIDAPNVAEYNPGVEEWMKVNQAMLGLGIVSLIGLLIVLICNCLCEPKKTNRGKVSDANAGRSMQKKEQLKFLNITIGIGVVVAVLCFVNMILRICILADAFTS